MSAARPALPRSTPVVVALLFGSCVASEVGMDDVELAVAGGTIEVKLDDDLPLPRTSVVRWVERAATALSSYYGRFPVDEVVLRVERGGRAPVSAGVARGSGRIDIRLGRDATEEALDRDWMLTHEMVHLAFPTLDDDWSWMMEGLSDYVEPVARARVGQTSAAEAWRGFVDGMPQGLPRPGDGGLDGTRSWGRIYWGGCLWWLLVDVAIRERTGNARSVDDALRAILERGGNGGAKWSVERVLDVGDRATGTRVMHELHESHGARATPVDLDDLWRRLGIRIEQGEIVFDDDAPLARVRAEITAAESNPGR
jgi:hypothetical protein